MKPIVVYDRDTGNGWWEGDDGTRYFYDRQGLLMRSIAPSGPPLPEPPPDYLFSEPGRGMSQQQKNLASQQAVERDAATAEQARLAPQDKGGEFDIKAEVRGLLMRLGVPDSTDE